MVVNYPLFVQILKEKVDKKEISKEKAMSLRNILSTIARTDCPVKMVLAFGRQINETLGKEIVKL